MKVNLSLVDQVGLRTVNDLLREQAVAHADKEFLVFEDGEGAVERFRYAEWQRAVEELAAGLAELGVTRGTKVALRMWNRPELVLSWFALARLGAVSVITIPLCTARETRHVTSHSDAEMVITDVKYRELYADLQRELPALTTIVVVGAEAPVAGAVRFEEIARPSAAPPEVALEPDADLQMLFTSGTTADPKAVVLTHANCLHAGARQWMVQALEPGWRSTAPASLASRSSSTSPARSPSAPSAS